MVIGLLLSGVPNRAEKSRERGEVFDPSFPRAPSRPELLEIAEGIALNPFGELRDKRLLLLKPWIYFLVMDYIELCAEKMPALKSENDNLFAMVENFKDQGLSTNKARNSIARMFGVTIDKVTRAHSRRCQRKRVKPKSE
jgi:hypothetical protein